ncbi:3103_t:CDS:2 [Funneliformis geosporum]|nr:3103_t:CDS:2 [Funneliformis geosporum]
MSIFLTSLSRDFSNILGDSDEYNVLIKVGSDENNEETFQAHSLVLKARSPYFKAALSNDWAKKEGNMMIFNKPNISPYIFELILKFMYTGIIEMEQQKGKDLLKLLKILPKDLYEDLKRFHLKTGLQLKSEYLQTQRYVGVKSTIIDQNHAAMLCSWIDGVGFNIYYKKNLSAKISRVSNNCSAYAISDSQSKGPCFGDGDLWMKDQFNQAGSCYCNKESYEQSVGDMFHRDSWEGWTGKNGTFAVDDYEVFQVIRKRIINN